MQESRSLISFLTVVFTFVCHSNNYVVDILDRNAISFGHCVWVEDVPSGLLCFINADLVLLVPIV